MKFGKHLDQALYEPWRQYYVNYKHLKNLLERYFKEEKEEMEEVVPMTYGSFDSTADEKGEDSFTLREKFIIELDKEVVKVNSHYKAMEEKLNKTFKAITAQAEAHHTEEAHEHGRHDHIYQSGISIACVNLYRTLNMLNNFVYLNKIGFDKIAKKFDKASGGHYRKTFEKKIAKTYFATSQGVSELLRDCAAFFANHFESGDVSKAKVRLLAKMTEGLYRKSDTLWLGMKIGIVITLLFWNAFNITVSPNLHINAGMSVYIPLYRAVGLMIALVWMWGFNVFIWSRYRINHVFIFEISPRLKLNHFEIWDEAASLSIVVLLNSLLFLHHQQYRLKTRLSEIVYPLALVAFILIKILSQVFTGQGKTGSVQKDIMYSMGSVFIAPFGRARFCDCYLADYFCSMQKIFADLQYSVCFYAIGFESIDPLQGSATCTNLGPILVPFVHALPYWWRFHQCMHRYLETQKRWPNLANAFKYMLCQVTVIIASLHPVFSQYQEAPWSPLRVFWFVLIIITTIYTYIWDLVLDWGLLEFNMGSRHPMLRQKRLFPSVYFYYWAMCSNLVLRFMWVVTLLPFPFQSIFPSGVEYQHVLLPLLTFLELFRRSQWGILRVEYEHLSTSQGFRKYKHLPLFFEKEVKRRETVGGNVWINIEVIFMVFLLVFFSVVLWVLK